MKRLNAALDGATLPSWGLPHPPPYQPPRSLSSSKRGWKLMSMTVLRTGSRDHGCALVMSWKSYSEMERALALLQLGRCLSGFEPVSGEEDYRAFVEEIRITAALSSPDSFIVEFELAVQS